MTKQIISFIVLIIILFTACSKNSTDPKEEEIPITYTKLSEGFDKATKVEVYIEKTPFVGFNKLYVVLFDSLSGTRITDAQVTIAPLMDMQTMQHAAPFMNPASHLAVDGYFPASVVFIMSGMWQLDVSFHRHDNNVMGSVHYEFNVEAASLVKKIDGYNGTTYFVTLIEPEKWQVGMNDIEFCINYRVNMMSFPPADSLSLAMEPWMDMGGGSGHGSPNNVNPTHTAEGHYQGNINYTMSGVWDIFLDISNSDSVIVETAFEVTVD